MTDLPESDTREKAQPTDTTAEQAEQAERAEQAGDQQPRAAEAASGEVFTPQPPRATLVGKFAVAAADIKIAHSIFALPFAVLAAFLAGPGRWMRTPDALSDTLPAAGVDGGSAAAEAGGGGFAGWTGFAIKLVLIVLCMVLARTWAMLVNRIADRKLDADNPRTAKRAFAAGKLSTADGLLMLAGSAGLFIGVCALFLLFFGNDWPVYGSIPVLLWIAFYSFTKRFTLLCHFFLGGALAVSPIAAAVAVDPEALQMPSIWLLAGMVLCWVAGFDVIYALQDHAHDSKAGLHSIPAKLGPKRAIYLSRLLHLICFALLCGAWVMNPNLSRAFGVGVGLTAVLLLTEHVVLAKRGEAGLNMAFFTVNGVISVVLAIAGITDLWI